MSAGTSGAEYRSGEFVPAGIFALVGLTGFSAWLLHGWLQRRFGLVAGPALFWAAMPGMLAGALVLLGVLRSRPRMDAEQRRRAAVAAEPKRRRHRVWLMLMLCLLLLGPLLDWPARFSGGVPDGWSWSPVLLVAMIVADCLRDFLPSRAATPGMAAPDQAERCEALRTGFLAAMILGGLAAAVAVRWPGVAAAFWLPVLLASVLAAEIRMAMLPRWTARLEGEAVRAPDFVVASSGLSSTDARARGWSGWRAVAGVLVWFGLMGVSVWLLHGWVERHSGLPADLAWEAAGLPGGVPGMLLILKIARNAPSADPEQRRREAERSERGRRRLRAWVILILCLVLLQQAVLVTLVSHGNPAGNGDWGSLTVIASLVMSGLGDFLSSGAGVSPGRVEFDQAERCEALRVGFLTLLVLGGLAAAAATWRPVNAAQAWPFVLLASVLAAEIRMATLPRRALPQPA